MFLLAGDPAADRLVPSLESMVELVIRLFLDWFANLVLGLVVLRLQHKAFTNSCLNLVPTTQYKTPLML